MNNNIKDCLNEIKEFFKEHADKYHIGMILIDSQSINDSNIRGLLSSGSVTRYSPVMNVYTLDITLGIEAHRENTNVTFMDEVSSSAMLALEDFVEYSGKYNFTASGHPSYSPVTREAGTWKNEIRLQIYISL